MLNRLTKLFTGKEIVLYDQHRQTLPLVQNASNRKLFWFINVGSIWRLIPFQNHNKRKHRIMYLILNLTNPRLIISMNWISRRESLYKVWTAKHAKSKFVVVEHGSYVGGIVTDIAHRYAKCDVFLTWGDYFTWMFREYNRGKKVEIITFGNPVYNDFNQDKIEPKNNKTGKVLLIPSPITYKQLPHFTALIEKLEEVGFSVYFKPHNFQNKPEYARIENVEILSGDLYTLLINNDFDFIISDRSSALLDAVFFKNPVIYFDNLQYTKGQKTHYSVYLKNLFEQDLTILTKEDFYSWVDIDKQEAMFSDMIAPGDNQIPIDIL